MASVREMMKGSIPVRANGRVSRESLSPCKVLATEWGNLKYREKQDGICKAMREEGIPCPISFAMTPDAQMKPISYRMKENELLTVLSDKAWPDTVGDVMNLEAFQDTTTDEIRAMRLKMGSVTLSGDEVFGILAGKEDDISISSQSKGKNTPVKASTKPVQAVEEEEEGEVPEGVYVKPARLKNETPIQYMQRCKRLKREAEAEAVARAKGEKPNSGTISAMASRSAAITAPQGSNRLRESIADAGGVLPTETRASRAGKQATPSAPTRAEIIARLLAEEQADTFSDEQIATIEGIVRKEIARSFARFLSLFPADYLPSEEEED